MKKTIIYGLIFIVIGIILGKYLNVENLKSLSVLNSGESYYFLQEGIYSTEEALLENTKDLESKLVENINDKFYVYLGITRNEEVADKIKKIYEDKGYKIYTKEVNLKNDEFYNNVTQFDFLINNTANENEIITIEEVVLANYEEITSKER